jgi:hypothetical protein
LEWLFDGMENMVKYSYDNREENKKVLIEDKLYLKRLFEDGDIRSQNEHITEFPNFTGF